MSKLKFHRKRDRLERYAASGAEDMELKSSVKWALVTIEDLQARLVEADDRIRELERACGDCM